MQNCREYNYTVTPTQIAEILRTYGNITVIINGEYYDVIPDTEGGEK